MKRWKRWLLAGLLITGIYLIWPASLPKLSLTFIGFATNGTSRVERLCFSNESRSAVWWWNSNYTILPENGAAQEILGGYFVPLMPFSNVVVTVPVPENCPRWQVELAFEYYRYPPYLRLFVERYVNTGKFAGMPRALNGILWFLNKLPVSKPQYGTVSSGFMTNTLDNYATATNSVRHTENSRK